MTDTSASRVRGRDPVGLLVRLVAVIVVAWVGLTIVEGVERASRTVVVDDFGSAGPIHLTPDGLILLARSRAGDARGWVETFDPVSRARTTVIDGLELPVAAAMAPDGTVCSVGSPATTVAPAQLRCSSGLAVDLERGDPAGLDDAQPVPADIVSDGAAGWVVSDVGRKAILHVDDSGRVEVVATIRQVTGSPAAPTGLASDGETVLVAIGGRGYVALSPKRRGAEVTEGRWVGGTALAIAARPTQPLVLVQGTDKWRVTYGVAADAAYPDLVPDLSSPRGLVVLPDGRIAVADGSRLVITRPKNPLP